MRTFLVFITLSLLISCGKDDSPSDVTPISKYTLSVTSTDGGTVSSQGGSYNDGSSVTITASPNSEYLFENWSNGSTENPLTITVNQNLSLTANFVKRKYPLTINIQGEGTVREEIVSSARSSDPTEYNSGTTLRLTAVPSEGWVFSDWTGDVESSNSTITVLLNEPKNLNVNFSEITSPTITSSLKSKMFTKGVQDTLSISLVVPGGFNSVDVSSELGNISIYSSPEEGSISGELVLEYTNLSVENVLWDRTIAGHDPIEIVLTDNNQIETSLVYNIRTQPEPNNLGPKRSSLSYLNTKYPLDIPYIRWKNLKDNYSSKNTCNGSENLLGPNGENLNQFENSFGYDATETGIFIDLNNDNYLDFLTIGGYKGPLGHGVIKSPMELFLYDDGEFIFQNILDTELFYNPIMINPGDFNNDGKNDFIVGSFNHDNNQETTNTKLFINTSDDQIEFDIIDLGYSSRFLHKAIYDFNNDGFLDYLQFTDFGNKLFIYNNGGFTEEINSILQLNDGELNESIFRRSKSFTITDINNDNSPDLLVTGGEFNGGKPVVFWGCSNLTNCDPSTQSIFSESRLTVLPKIIDWGLILEHNLIDIDNDGTLEILLNRSGAGESDGGGEEHHLGWRIQLIKVENLTELIDITDTYFENFMSDKINGECQGENHYIFNMGLFDYDNDGNLEYFNLPDQGHINHEWELIGSKFIKVKP